MAGKLVPTIKTDPSLEEVFNVVAEQVLALVTDQPAKPAINLLLAHFVTEVGLDKDETLKACYNYSAGNKRPRKDKNGQYIDNYCLYACGEELPLSEAVAIVNESPYAKIISKYQKTFHGKTHKISWSEPYASVHFEPTHPSCRFRSYNDLRSSIEGQFEYLSKKPRALSALLAGDVLEYSIALESYGYYTASLSRYTHCLLGALKQVEAITKRYDWTYIE